MSKYSTIELLDDLICDLKDVIEDYTDDVRRGCGRIEQYEKRIRIDELSKWLQVLKVIREEQSDNESE